MKTNRSILSLAALIVLAISLYDAAGAQAGSLLSGYGGPGQGNQAILGSTLLGGPSGGSGGSAGGGGGSGESSQANGASALSGSGQAASSQSSGSSGGGSQAGQHHGARHSRTHTASSVPGSSTGASARLAPSAATSKEGSQPLGLSGRDLLYALLVLALLVATAVLTLRLARLGPAVGSTKGMGRGTRVTE